MSGNFLSKYTEDEIRFSLSCKFHIFRDQEEKLTAEEIISVLTNDLKKRKVLKGDEKMRLFDLAPILVNEYILPYAPTSDVIDNVWRNYEIV